MEKRNEREKCYIRKLGSEKQETIKLVKAIQNRNHCKQSSIKISAKPKNQIIFNRRPKYQGPKLMKELEAWMFRYIKQ